MNPAVTLDEVIASYAVNPNGVLKVNFKTTRDLKSLNAKSQYDATYIKFDFITKDGKLVYPKFKCTETPASSGAKPPQGIDEGAPKYLNIAFTNLTVEDIAGGPYTPMQIKNVADKVEKARLQKIEDDIMAGNITRYYNNNEKLLKVLDILNTSFTNCCKELIASAASLPFRLFKDKNQKTIPIFQFKQTTRINGDTHQEEVLEKPIFRMRLPVDKNTGKIGVNDYKSNQVKPIVFDTRKMTEKNDYKPVPAKVKIDDEMRELDADNAKDFITYKSLLGGNFTIEMVSSKFGLSSSIKFVDLYVMSNRVKNTTASFSKEDIMMMQPRKSNQASDSEEESEEDNSAKNKHSKSNSDPDEDDASDDDVVMSESKEYDDSQDRAVLPNAIPESIKSNDKEKIKELVDNTESLNIAQNKQGELSSESNDTGSKKKVVKPRKKASA